MTEKNMSLDDIRSMAADIGMNRLTDEHLQELLRATKAAAARRALLPVDALVPADEPAHVFSLTAEGKR